MSREKQLTARAAAEDHLQELRVDTVGSPRRHSHSPVGEKARLPKMSSRSANYVYVNQAYVGSSVNLPDNRLQLQSPVTSVIREQYWTCSKWPLAQRILAVAVGLLVGTVVGLAVTMAIRGQNAEDIISGIFRSVPD